MPHKEEEIALRNEEVHEMLGSTPAWIFRWGISVVFLLIVLGLTLSYFISYPDVLVADITLTTSTPPVNISSKSNGKLIHLLVKDKQYVKKGQILGVLENTAFYEDVLSGLEITKNLSNHLIITDTTSSFSFKEDLKMGEITPHYLQCIKSIKELNFYKAVNPINKQINAQSIDLENYNSLIANYKRQQNISNEQLKLAESDYNRDKKLFEEKVISPREFENQKRSYLSVLNSNEQIKVSISNALIQANAIEKNMLQLRLQDFQEKNRLRNEALLQFKSLISEIYKWKEIYLLESPVNGKVSFFGSLNINQNIKVDDELMTIVQTQKPQFFGKCSLSVSNSGKLSVGQKVNIKLDMYPYNENGVLIGEVVDVSEVPSNNKYSVTVRLINGLKTNYNKTLTYKQEMKGKAEIITKNMSVLDRLFFSFKKLNL